MRRIVHPLVVKTVQENDELREMLLDFLRTADPHSGTPLMEPLSGMCAWEGPGSYRILYDYDQENDLVKILEIRKE